MSKLDDKIARLRIKLERCRHANSNRTDSVAEHLGRVLYERFCESGALTDLEETLTLARSTLLLRAPGHPDRALSLDNIAFYLSVRFNRLGVLSNLEEAIALQRKALELCPPGHTQRPGLLDSAANFLATRFDQLGTLSDLEEALTLGRSALELRSLGHGGRATSLNNMSTYLFTRFKQFGALSDLEEALALARSALEIDVQHSDPATLTGNIAHYLFVRFKQLGALSDLQEALALQRRVLQLRPPGHPKRTVALSHIASYLHARFKQLGALSDLEQAIALERSVLELRPQGHPRRAASLSNVASYLFTRFDELRAPLDLEEAIFLERSAMKLRPQGHPDRALSLGSLARAFHVRFKHSTSPDIVDLQETFNLYSQLSDVSRTAFLNDVRCAKQWAEAAEECKHDTTVLAYQTFMRLSGYYLATLPSLPQHLSLLKQLVKSMAVDAFSAGIRYGNPAIAVELLEQGRGTFWRQLGRLRSPLDDVIGSGDAGKELADKFAKLVSVLRSVLNDPLDGESQHSRAFNLNIQLQDVVVEIRKLPGLSHFLQLPLFSDLQEAAVGGPVIMVNASQYGCDAIVLLFDRDPIHIPLRTTRAHVSKLSSTVRILTLRAKIMSVAKEFVDPLRELWDVVVSPILQILREFYPFGLRIWWCPTAEFSLLPLHAAVYISSYTPTLTSLIHARRNRLMNPSTEQHRFLVVGQAQATGLSKLDSVGIEVSNISKLVESITSVTRIQDQDATISRVCKQLKKTHFVHLACHGVPNPKNPFESGFGLGDGLLKVERIMRYNLRRAQFAYLSACHTTVGDEDSPDEMIHLAAAMQFAGFGSVIGTMWAVDDAHTDEITSKFYMNMQDECGCLDPSRAALALHKTTRSLFSTSNKIPFDQRILYVHIGP